MFDMYQSGQTEIFGCIFWKLVYLIRFSQTYILILAHSSIKYNKCLDTHYTFMLVRKHRKSPFFRQL